MEHCLLFLILFFQVSLLFSLCQDLGGRGINNKLCSIIFNKTCLNIYIYIYMCVCVCVCCQDYIHLPNLLFYSQSTTYSWQNYFLIFVIFLFSWLQLIFSELSCNNFYKHSLISEYVNFSCLFSFI